MYKMCGLSAVVSRIKAKFWGHSSSVGAWHRRDKVGRAHRKFWGHSSVGRAPALQAGGRQFESDWLHHQFLLSCATRTIKKIECLAVAFAKADEHINEE